MKLTSDWAAILRHAWSVRLMLLAALFDLIELVLPFFQTQIPPGLFIGFSGLACVGALIARLVHQKRLRTYHL
jgi:uncharacterized integral membrane protein